MTRYICRILTHKTPCCGDEFMAEFPPDMQADEEWVIDKVVCRKCRVNYQLVLTDFRRHQPKSARWYTLTEAV